MVECLDGSRTCKVAFIIEIGKDFGVRHWVFSLMLFQRLEIWLWRSHNFWLCFFSSKTVMCSPPWRTFCKDLKRWSTSTSLSVSGTLNAYGIKENINAILQITRNNNMLKIYLSDALPSSLNQFKSSKIMYYLLESKSLNI